jgi:hypothetical protein
MKLSDLQKSFSQFLYSSGNADPNFLNQLNSSGPVPIAAGLSAYKNNFVLAVVDAMSQTYPKLVELLEMEGFRFFVRDYLYSHPSTSFDLGEFGREFPKFLSHRAELQAMPWVQDLGRFEWSWEKLELGFGSYRNPFLKPELSLGEFEYDVLRIWQDLPSIVDTPPTKETQFIVFWNEDENNRAESIHRDLFKFLRLYAENKSLKEIQMATGLDGPTTSEMETYGRGRKWIL